MQCHFLTCSCIYFSSLSFNFSFFCFADDTKKIGVKCNQIPLNYIFILPFFSCRPVSLQKQHSRFKLFSPRGFPVSYVFILYNYILFDQSHGNIDTATLSFSPTLKAEEVTSWWGDDYRALGAMRDIHHRRSSQMGREKRSLSPGGRTWSVSAGVVDTVMRDTDN